MYGVIALDREVININCERLLLVSVWLGHSGKVFEFFLAQQYFLCFAYYFLCVDIYFDYVAR